MEPRISYMILAWNQGNHIWSLHGTKEIIYDSLMKPRKSYMILWWNLGNHIWFLNEIRETIYDPCMKSRKSLMNLMGNQVLKSSITSHITSKNAEKQFTFLLTNLQLIFFSFLKLVWLPGNHTNHIWPCMITGENATQKLIILLTLECFFTERALYLLRLESLNHIQLQFFSFMKLVWIPGNHTNHIWPCMITGKNEPQKLIAGLVWCISYRMSVIAVTIRVVYNYFLFFVWNLYDYREIIQIIYDLVWLPGIVYDLVWNQGKLYDGQPGPVFTLEPNFST